MQDCRIFTAVLSALPPRRHRSERWSCDPCPSLDQPSTVSVPLGISRQKLLSEVRSERVSGLGGKPGAGLGGKPGCRDKPRTHLSGDSPLDTGLGANIASSQSDCSERCAEWAYAALISKPRLFKSRSQIMYQTALPTGTPTGRLSSEPGHAPAA